ncbi:MAG: Gfo/Idh/MocA family oxidoreductase [Moraxellaceae bacterium]|nr:Gfo/Idh/MocA family oxidoreductase [Moraxellaceae bacterium]
MKVCIIGGSGHYQYVLDGLAGAQVSLVGYAPGVADEKLEKLESALKAAGVEAPRFARWQDMLDELRPDIVVVNTWFGACAAISMECLRRGHHVYAEKPLATTLDDLHALRAVYLEGLGAQLGAMFGLRYVPAMYSAWRFVRAGGIGAVRMVGAQKSYRLGRREVFYHTRDSYGGTIPWVGAHAVDWVRWFAGAEFERVTALHSTQGNRGQGEVEVTAACLFAMAGGVIGHVNLDYLRPDSQRRHDDDRVRVVGTEGVLEVRDGQVTMWREGAAEAVQLQLESPPQCFADFVAGLRGQGCLVSAEDAFAVTEASLLARQAADAGGTASFSSQRLGD